jgi:hypothetical protein
MTTLPTTLKKMVLTSLLTVSSAASSFSPSPVASVLGSGASSVSPPPHHHTFASLSPPGLQVHVNQIPETFPILVKSTDASVPIAYVLVQ